MHLQLRTRGGLPTFTFVHVNLVVTLPQMLVASPIPLMLKRDPKEGAFVPIPQLTGLLQAQCCLPAQLVAILCSPTPKRGVATYVYGIYVGCQCQLSHALVHSLYMTVARCYDGDTRCTAPVELDKTEAEHEQCSLSASVDHCRRRGFAVCMLRQRLVMSRVYCHRCRTARIACIQAMLTTALCLLM